MSALGEIFQENLAMAACPFCGTKNERNAGTAGLFRISVASVKSDVGDLSAVRCSGCKAQGPVAATKANAMALWAKLDGIKERR